MADILDQLSDAIRSAAGNNTPLCLRGGGSKDFYGGPLRGETLAVGAYRGIVDYEPSELVITARAGTPLAEIEAVLREQGQMLAFEPPHFDATPSSPALPMNVTARAGSTTFSSPGKRDGDEGGLGNNIGRAETATSPQTAPKSRMATLGGCIAAGLSGPRRAYAGAARDFVLGVRMLDGKGSDLHFGGQVMKNVAGFDVSRLMTGSLGTLGVILEVSLKVLPLPAAEATLGFEKSAHDAIKSLNEWAGRPLPISATAWNGGVLRVRLSGAAAAVDAAVNKLGGERYSPQASVSFWQGIRDQSDAFFKTSQPLWRLSLKSTTPALSLPGTQMIEWSGALRWLATDAEAHTIRATALAAGGHATLFRASDKSAGVFQPLTPALMTIQQNLKRNFDPAGIFNPGRLYDNL